jgi:hypothetical protein
MAVAKQVKEFFHTMGIHSTTIQLEYAEDTTGYVLHLKVLLFNWAFVTRCRSPQSNLVVFLCLRHHKVSIPTKVVMLLYHLGICCTIRPYGVNHKVHICLEYYSVCPFVGIGTPILSPASECV